MYGNQIMKFTFTLVLFALVFGFVKPLDSLALLLAFIGSQVLAALLPVVIAKQTSVNR
jgi:F0F1-type ATP synthase assembly protein I